MKAIENKIMAINSKLFQLPDNFKTGIANYLWLLTILSIILNILAIMAILGIGALSGALLYGTGLGYFTFKIWLIVLSGVIGTAIVVIIEILAVKPLKNKLYRGWHLMLCAICLQVVFTIVYLIASMSFSDFLRSLLNLAISLYFLAQTREHFN